MAVVVSQCEPNLVPRRGGVALRTKKDEVDRSTPAKISITSLVLMKVIVVSTQEGQETKVAQRSTPVKTSSMSAGTPSRKA
jgi:hypothetical protein